MQNTYRQALTHTRELVRHFQRAIDPEVEMEIYGDVCRRLVHRACQDIILWQTMLMDLIGLKRIRSDLRDDIQPL